MTRSALVRLSVSAVALAAALVRLSVSAVALAAALTLSSCAGTPVQPSQGQSATVTPTPSASTPPAVINPQPVSNVVPVSAPTRLSFPAAAIDTSVEEFTAAQAEAEGGINPAELDTVVYYSGIADALPGSDATNTVYLFGHSWVEPAAFNGLVDVKPGDEATVTTANGQMVYEVTETISMSKNDFTEDERVAAVVPGRLALVTCLRPDGWDRNSPAPDNVVVFLQLVSSSAQR